ncbi:WD domain, g-beta repeat domain-containing protein [Sarocladium implicatum]|nr:WD domain, g-beta repeat domain-containing protein [Sarocladium implicatum]
MATIAPPPSKRQRREQLERTQVQQDVTAASGPAGSFKARFLDGDGQQMADVIEVPLADASEKNLSLLLNTLLMREKEEYLPYRFRIHIPETDIIVDQYPTDLLQLLRSHGIENPFETTVTLSAEPQAVFKVQAVTRMAHRVPGHGEAILAVQFSPANSARLATGSGDKTARILDADTGTSKYTLAGHTHWVLCVAWSPDGERLATGSMDKSVRLWDPNTGKAVGSPLTGHAKWITNIAWEPYHLWKDGTPRLASASKDATIRTWVVNTGRTEHVLSGHRSSVSCVKWGGTGLIYSASHDKTVRVWDAEKGTLVHTLSAHAHWVNHLALSTDFALRTSFYDHTPTPADDASRREKAKERFEKAAKIQGKVAERLVSASDDFTMYLWDPSQGTKPVARMLGHQKQVNHVTFSPDGSLIASAGWDNHTKIWSARDGKFINTLRGHVGPVYQCSFSADSRLLVTASKDTTLKVWSMASHKLAADLPGHQDEVFAVDWSPDGQRVGSGGKDKAVRLWRN